MSALFEPPRTPPPDAPAPPREPAKLDPELQTRLVLLEQERIRKERLRRRVWRERRVLLPVFAVVLLLFPNFRLVKVVGRSMEPQFQGGQSLIVLKTWRRFSPLKEGDIIVFHRPEEPDMELVKRIAFIQDADGRRPWPKTIATSRGPVSSYFFARFQPQNRNQAPVNPSPSAGTIFVIGDNIENSMDSRDFGPITPEVILGKVVLLSGRLP